MKKFPETMFVERQDEGTVNECLLVHESFKDVAVAGEKIRVAVYKLAGIKTVTATPELQ